MFNAKITSKMNVRGVNTPVMKEWLFKNLQTAWRECARAFFEAAAQRVSIDTGMSMASMLPLASKVRAAKLLQERISSEKGDHKKNFYTFPGGVKTDRKKMPSKGEAAGRKALSSRKHDISFGTPSAPQLIFKFEVVVFQFQIREHGLDDNSPWAAIEAGRAAFLARWQEVLPKYIRSKDIIDWFNGRKLKDRSHV